jgi:hypothetical protein
MNEIKHIAPCGMNCLLCMAYQRNKKHCPGCKMPDENKSKSCVACVIKNCSELRHTNAWFCYSCSKFPCKRLKQLDLRYRTKYGMSMIENLHSIEKHGTENFAAMENNRWKCSVCGSLFCVHRENCQNCGNINISFPLHNHVRSRNNTKTLLN